MSEDYHSYYDDPDELLGRVRAMLRRWMDTGHLNDDDTCELVQATAQLDAWLNDGGDLPMAWAYRPPPRRKTVDLPPL